METCRVYCNSFSELTDMWLTSEVLAWYSSFLPGFIISLSVCQLWCELKMELGLSGWLSSDAISNDQVSLWYPKEISGSTTLHKRKSIILTQWMKIISLVCFQICFENSDSYPLMVVECASMCFVWFYLESNSFKKWRCFFPDTWKMCLIISVTLGKSFGKSGLFFSQ